MNGTDLCFLSAAKLAEGFANREFSPVDVTTAMLERIEGRQPIVNAFTVVLPDSAIEEAKASEARIMKGEARPLEGIPVALKDGNARAGALNTAGSRLLAENVEEKSVAHVARIEDAGAVIIGITNMPELGYKGSTDNYIFGATSLPFAPAKNAGGSSGGSAAAVADGCAALALGGDGGGSIRIPAAICGVFGLISSYGRIPLVLRPDAFAAQTPFGYLGPLTRTVEDAAMLARVLAGPDTRDPLTLPETADPYDFRGREVNGLRVAFAPSFGGFPVLDSVAGPVGAAVATLDGLGVGVDEREPDFGLTFQELIDAWTQEWLVGLGTQLRLLERGGIPALGERRDELDPLVLKLAEKGLLINAVDLRLSDVARAQVIDAMEALFTEFDAIVCPTNGVPAWDNATDGSTTGPAEVAGTPVDSLGGWALTAPVNMSGYPAASVPVGFTDDGLPVGMQIVGRRFDESTVLALSSALESALPWQDSYAKLRA